MRTARCIDLTLTLCDGQRGVSFEQVRTLERDGWNARTLHLYSHAGTHMDAQTHFAAGNGTIDQIPLNRCTGPAWVIRLPHVRPKQLHNVADLGPVADRFRPGDGLLLHSGWSRHLNDASLYRDQLPRVSDELAHWCADHQVNFLGVEPPSVADVNNLEELTRIHKILLSAGITIVEGLGNLDALRAHKVFFVAAPLKIAGGDGSPCRAFAFESELDSDPIILPL